MKRAGAILSLKSPTLTMIFLQNQLSVTDNKLDAGQFSIEGTLISIQDKTWNVGGTIIENVHLSGETPVIGSRNKIGRV